MERDVLLAARTQFWHRGYESTSLTDLCEATGVASQSLYGAFGSKHDLFVRTLDDYCTEQIAGLDAGRRAAGSPWQWLLAAVTFDDGGRIGLSSDGCYLSGSTAALCRIDDDVQLASQKTYERILDLFTETVVDGQAAGEIRDDVEARQIAYALLAAMQGLEFIRKSGLGDAFDTAKTSVTDGLELAYAARVAPAAAD
ncbi:TetR family transcriptional regulator [Microlunatus endophyticus]|uniref:TetR family transcriptional regulator n=1 Tax=Microlunatus endophyticus TaxID=1716077 RepID=A0A917W701_9ACTN|nr:TetR family transcriptional regulator [Microlunatus endophyticus]